MKIAIVGAGYVGLVWVPVFKMGVDLLVLILMS